MYFHRDLIEQFIEFRKVLFLQAPNLSRTKTTHTHKFGAEETKTEQLIDHGLSLSQKIWHWQDISSSF